MGGYFPIRIQSMTNTNTMDTLATVEQTIRLVEAGCDYVRITAQGLKEAENLAKIKKELITRGYEIPLIADVHFNPEVAEVAARIVEKVRINPGNYTDKKRFEKNDYSDVEYAEEINKIRDRISPLIKICKEYGTAIRIGTNHGSLSDRIISRYGDTPMGMAESAVEFIRICEDLDFGNIVLSMKASNIKVMIAACRLLVHKMMKENMDYPLHIGVTEAGSGEEGRIKSAAGIGALLEDGIGDTIRVSLTEEPEAEIPVAKILVNRYSNRHYDGHEIESDTDGFESPVNPFEFYKYNTKEVLNVGKDNDPIVIITANKAEEKNEADYIFTENNSLLENLNNTPAILSSTKWNNVKQFQFPLFEAKNYFHTEKKSTEINFVTITSADIIDEFIEKINDDHTVVLVLEPENNQIVCEQRKIFFNLINSQCKRPVIIKRKYTNLTVEEFQLFTATDIALLMTDGLGDGVWLEAEKVDTKIIEKTAFDILQATGTRVYKTEYVSCPTCGRTSFNIKDTVEQVKRFTSHLTGLKIAIMGCVVNGPGEMADADYGYVGSSEGKINLYKGKCLVKRNIDEENALDALINLIKENGDWVEEN
ncbi:MAG: (E)-4-hydroxy-3-methylbut-2-enyl-diphosphate synthase [Bacteroidetes bacterium]|nr:(E)-4-hydroxy-3-methylbut-2-enyl-diphosphate synthase [Bacteroidota bacterium]